MASPADLVAETDRSIRTVAPGSTRPCRPDYLLPRLGDAEGDVIANLTLKGADVTDRILGEISMFAGTFAPDGWAFCDGRELEIASNTALFSVIGTMYGGDGQRTFALPDLCGRVPVGTGQGNGLPSVDVGQVGGEATHALSISEVPAIDLSVTTGSGSSVVAHVVAADPAGTAQPHNIMQPYLGVNYIIVVNGIIPQRGPRS
jgi:microcystin-dependent protein